VCLFRGVDQEKEERESSRGHRALFDGKSVYLAEETLQRHGVTIAMASSARGNAQLLDDLKRLLPLETLDYASQCTRKPADVLVEGKIFWTGCAPRAARVVSGAQPGMARFHAA
jgi:hypothetical protein